MGCGCDFMFLVHGFGVFIICLVLFRGLWVWFGPWRRTHFFVAHNWNTEHVPQCAKHGHAQLKPHATPPPLEKNNHYGTPLIHITKKTTMPRLEFYSASDSDIYLPHGPEHRLVRRKAVKADVVVQRVLESLLCRRVITEFLCQRDIPLIQLIDAISSSLSTPSRYP